MKKLLGGLILVSLFWLGGGQAVLAVSDEPVASCEPPFELHHVMDHDNHHHHHIGSDTDRNVDGYLCVKHVSVEKHLHIDNNVRMN